MTTKLSLTTLLVMLLITIDVTHAQSLLTPSGHVRGTIFDSNGAVVTKVKVIFESNRQKREVKTNEKGDYEIALPVGVYRVTTDSTGFCASQRALFRVQSLSDTVMNLTLVVCPIANILTFDKAGKYVGEECRYVDPFESESFQVTNLSGAPLNLLIRYGKRQERENAVEYQGAEVKNGAPPGVTVSFDVLTIVADRVRFDKQRLFLEAEGQVVVEDGKRRLTFSHAEVNFKSTDPIVTLRGRK